MRKVLLVMVVLLMFSVSLPAQQAPVAEFFGGYSYNRAQLTGREAVSTHGWNGAFAVNANRWLGIVADFSGHYGTDKFVAPNVDFNLHNILFGPQFTYRGEDTVVHPFARVLLGATRASAGYVGLTTPTTEFTWGLGGGVDISLSESVALRAIQADFIRTTFNNMDQNHARLSVGLNFKFGSR